jgi:hypothetical protein
MNTDITMTDLDLQAVELLPARAALQPHFGANFANVTATNLAIATNSGVSFGPWSGAHATAIQGVWTLQG